MSTSTASPYRRPPAPARAARPSQPAPGETLRLFLPCPRGLEGALAEEVAEIAAASGSDTLTVEQTGPGGVQARGGLHDVMRLNLYTRIPSRVLLLAASRVCADADAVYRLTRGLAWERWFGPDHSLRVDVTAERSPLQSIKFAALRVKDGICDRLRDLTGRRPDVDTAQPDVRVHLHLNESAALLYLDTSGEPLFKRGWRSAHGAAPLKENLAAGLLRLAGWQPDDVLFDPMCGAGTLVIEAAQIAARRAPGLDRRFGFERLAGFDAAAWAALREQARQQIRPLSSGQFFTADIDPAQVRMTLDNARRAGVDGAIAAQTADVIDAQPPVDSSGLPAGRRAWLFSNPPYDQRIAAQGARAGDFAQALSHTLKTRFAHWQAALLTADLQWDRALRLKPRRRIVVFNGPIECRLMLFDLIAGSARSLRGSGLAP